MANVVSLPTRGIPRKQVSAKAIWKSPEPSTRMVHAVCPYLRKDDRCRGCERTEEFGEYGDGQRMCYGLAAEVCRIVMAVQREEAVSKTPSPEGS